MPKITDALWLKFRDESSNTPFEELAITEDMFKAKLEAIHFKDEVKLKQLRAIFIIAYYFGLRPIEILSIKPKMVTESKGRFQLLITAAKHGTTGTLMIPMKGNPLIKEAYQTIKQTPDFPITDKAGNKIELFAFHNWIKESNNTIKGVKKINVFNDKGEVIVVEKLKEKTYKRTTTLLRYHAKKWLGHPLQYFRHNCFSYASKNGAALEDILNMKLGKSTNSVRPYVRFSLAKAEKVMKYYKRN